LLLCVAMLPCCCVASCRVASCRVLMCCVLSYCAVLCCAVLCCAVRTYAGFIHIPLARDLTQNRKQPDATLRATHRFTKQLLFDCTVTGLCCCSTARGSKAQLQKQACGKEKLLFVELFHVLLPRILSKHPPTPYADLTRSLRQLSHTQQDRHTHTHTHTHQKDTTTNTRTNAHTNTHTNTNTHAVHTDKHKHTNI
jgi:hypothetical protein